MNPSNKYTRFIFPLRRLGGFLGGFIDGVLIFVILYLLTFYVLSSIQVNTNYREPVEGVDIWLVSNGVHTDIAVPVKNEYKDWSEDIDYRETVAQDSSMEYLSFGWGDKGFYLDTPTWAELKPGVAFRASFWLSTTAMHATFYKSMPASEKSRKIRVGEEEYLKIVRYIDNQFQRENGNVIFIPGVPTYGDNDSFYEAKNRYSIFFTCNSWTNQCLKQAGVKACVWTPFEKGLF